MNPLAIISSTQRREAPMKLWPPACSTRSTPSYPTTSPSSSFFLNGEGRRHHLINFKKASFFYHIIEAGFDAGPHSFHSRPLIFSPGGTLVENSKSFSTKFGSNKVNLIDP